MNKIPNQQLLIKISKKINNFPNKQGEYKRQIHYGLFLLCHKSGLRVSEAVKFDLATKTKKGLYRINRPKGKKERFAYIPKAVIKELKKHRWQPNQTNRWNFYHFLKKIKRDLNISQNIELSPHTLRRSFTTHHANSGMPLPVLQKQLGHSSIRTTALYWRNSEDEDDNDTAGILASKKWLEKEPSAPPNFPEQLSDKPAIPTPKTVIKHKQTSIIILITSKPKKDQFLLTKINNLEEQLTQIQTENSNLNSKLTQLAAEKEQAEAIAQQEKNRADQFAEKLLQKTKEQENQAQIIHLPLGKGKQ